MERVLRNKAGNLYVIYLDKLSIYQTVKYRRAFSRIDYEQSPFFLRDSRASETRACVRENHPTQERRDAVGREKNEKPFF